MEQLTLLAKKWKIDANHSDITFKVKHLGLATIRGTFSEYEGIVTLEENAGFQNARVEVSIQAESITTGNTMRDNHLKTDEFFGCYAWPTITFEGSSFTKKNEAEYELKGMLTMKGISKEITIAAMFEGMRKDLWGNEVVVFSVKGSINRFDFDIKWNELLDGNIPAIGKMIDFDMNIELLQNHD